MSHETVRISLRSPCSSSSGQVRSGECDQLERRLRTRILRRAERLARERQQPDPVGHLLPDERHGHDEVLVRAQARECGQRRVCRQGLAQRRARIARQQERGAAGGHVEPDVLARAECGQLREELGLRARPACSTAHPSRRAAARARPRRAGRARRRRSRARCRSARSGAAARTRRAGRRSRSGRARPARRGGARAGRRARGRTAALRARCGTASARAARRRARTRRSSCGCEKS